MRFTALLVVLLLAEASNVSGQEIIDIADTLSGHRLRLELYSDRNEVKVYRDLTYDSLFTRDKGWNGGDGVFTTLLPGGNIFWVFNDSFFGRVGQQRNRTDANFPRNSLMLEHEGKQIWLVDYINRDQPNAPHYFHARTHLRNPDARLSPEEIRRGKIDQDYLYWAGGAVVNGEELQQLWFAVDNRKKKMISYGISLATYSLKGEIPQGRYSDSLPDYFPQQGDYLNLERVEHFINRHPISYGSTLLKDKDGQLYLYGTFRHNTVVARTRDLSQKWEYGVRNDEGEWVWQSNYPTEAQINRSSIVKDGAVSNMPWVFRRGEWYYLLSQAAFLSREIVILRSRTPYGPFAERRTLFHLPDHIRKLGTQEYHWLYMVNLHEALSQQGELVLTTNTDCKDFDDNFHAPGSADFYRPFFYRIFNWKSVFDSAGTQ